MSLDSDASARCERDARTAGRGGRGAGAGEGGVRVRGTDVLLRVDRLLARGARAEGGASLEENLQQRYNHYYFTFHGSTRLWRIERAHFPNIIIN